jgi:hypothetical protein
MSHFYETKMRFYTCKLPIHEKYGDSPWPSINKVLLGLHCMNRTKKSLLINIDGMTRLRSIDAINEMHYIDPQQEVEIPTSLCCTWARWTFSATDLHLDTLAHLSISIQHLATMCWFFFVHHLKPFLYDCLQIWWSSSTEILPLFCVILRAKSLYILLLKFLHIAGYLYVLQQYSSTKLLIENIINPLLRRCTTKSII